MPSKLRKAIGAVKDQTSISIAKVYTHNGIKSNLDVIVLKATRHDEVPVDERYVRELLNIIYANKVHAAACAQVIGKRIGKTRNWIVALKSLILVFRIFQDGDPYFPREVLHAMKRGAKILNLSTFRDDSHSSPWDFTAFVRTFALYLDERLDCFLAGKLQKKFNKRNRNGSVSVSVSVNGNNDPVCEMKPATLLDKISYWQKLLDKAIATRPTGTAKTNKLVKISLYAVAEESFDLYHDISEGLALLLDSFFHLQYQFCVSAFQLCVKASKQFEELCSFYDLCKSIGVGRMAEYPSVQKISEELIETLKEFLKDQASFPCHGVRSPTHSLLPAPPAKDQSSNGDRFSERESELGGSHYKSSEDLMSLTKTGTSNSNSMDRYLEQYYKQSASEDIVSTTDHSGPTEQGTISASNSLLDLVSLEDWPPLDMKEEQEQEQGKQTWALDSAMSNNCWEIVLFETANQPAQDSQNALTLYFDNQHQTDVANDLFSKASTPQNQYNPFLQDNIEIPMLAAISSNDQRVFPIDDLFAAAPTFQATPTFRVRDDEEAVPFSSQEDPFATCTMADTQRSNHDFMDQQILMHEQQLWLQNQDKIIAKNMA